MAAGPCPYCRTPLPDDTRRCPTCSGPIAVDDTHDAAPDDDDETDKTQHLHEGCLATSCLAGCFTDLFGPLAALLASVTSLALIPEAYLLALAVFIAVLTVYFTLIRRRKKLNSHQR